MAVRQALDFLETSALAWVLTSDERYLERGILEAANLCGDGWVDWNPFQHTLDVGEAVGAVGQFYDWTASALNASVKQLVTGAIISKGLQPLAQGINNGSHSFWWLNNTINWNCVVSAGAMTGVLAVVDEPGGAGLPYWASVFQPLLQSIPYCMAAYSPEGSWEEGPAYWGYASKYNVLAFAALNSSLGTDYGLSLIPGVRPAGTFELHMTGAGAGAGTGKLFNWADASTGGGMFPFAQWWGNRFGDATAAFYSRLVALQSGGTAVNSSGTWGGFAESLLHYSPLGSPEALTALPTGSLYSLINVAQLRSTWASADPAAEHVLFAKGGDSGWNHNHLDLGSWVFDFAGVRFASDMGMDNYSLPGYFTDSVRFGYYRLGSHGHNVPMLGGRNQSFPAVAPIVAFSNVTTDNCAGFVVVNLTQAYAPAYAGGAASALRGIVALPGVRGIVVVDELTFDTGSSAAAAAAVPPLNLTAAMHTLAGVSMHSNGTAAELTGVRIAANGTRTDVTVNAALLSAAAGAACPGALLTATPIDLAPPQDSTSGFTRIDAVVQGAAAVAACTRLAFAVGDPMLVGGPAGLQGQLQGVVLRPVAEWAASGPFQ